MFNFFGTWITTVAFFTAIFFAFGANNTKKERDDIIKWLRKRNPGRSVPTEWPQVFAGIFDRYFGEKHISWRCISKSCLWSFLSVLILFFISNLRNPGSYDIVLLFTGTKGIKNLLISVMQTIIVPNYISLLKSRITIHSISNSYYSKSASYIFYLLLRDLLLTFLIALCIYYFDDLVLYIKGKDILYFTVASRYKDGRLQHVPMITKQIGYISLPHLWQAIILRSEKGVYIYSTFYPFIFISLFFISGCIVGLVKNIGEKYDAILIFFERQKYPLFYIGLIVSPIASFGLCILVLVISNIFS